MEKETKQKRILCPECKTGMESYLIDKNSAVCPYIACYCGYSCSYFMPVDKCIAKDSKSQDE